MLISNKNRLVFIHIAKNAGMAVTKLLRSKVGFNGVIVAGPSLEIIGNPVRQYFANRKRNRVEFSELQCNAAHELSLLKKHSFASEIRLTVPRYDKYRRFCVVRNPFDRTVSQYHYIVGFSGRMRNRLLQRHFETIKAMSGFGEFEQKGLPKVAEQNFFAPQSRYIEGDDAVDIVRFENINVELRDLMAKYSIYTDKSISPENASRRNPRYQNYYNKASIEAVSEIYAEDLEQFEYSYQDV